MDYLLGCPTGRGSSPGFSTCTEFGSGGMITFSNDHYSQPGRVIRIADIVVNTEPSWIINKRLEEARSKLSKADAAGKPVTASEAQILQFRQDVLEEDRAAKRQQQQQNVEEFERRFASSVRPPAPSTSAVTVTAAPRAVENSALEQPMPPRSTEKVDFLKSILGDTISRSHGKVVPGLGHVKGGEHEGDAEALPQRVMIS